MHPIERLRHVARAGGIDPIDLAVEAARALAAFGDDPAGLVAGARRLVARHPTVGPVWWVCSRALVAADPVAEIRRSVTALEADTTAPGLAAALPEGATVLVVGWPDAAIEALAARGDVSVLAADDGTGVDLGRLLARVEVEVEDVPAEAVGAAAAHVDLVLVEALVAGPDEAMAAPGSRAAAAVAHQAGRTVWLLVPTGRVLPAPLYETARRSARGDGDPWLSGHDRVPGALVERGVGPDGPGPLDAVLGRPDCPIAPELLRPGLTPGSHHP